MPALFPRALAACISEGRAPLACELDAVADKLLREALPRCGGERGIALAQRMAHMALSGRRPS